ncbi:hypothetical protein SDC9_92916 [bioreactor metagenome]|uniref:DUF4249 domain-containing protein n=1 Tax=bioreactor metagenome TaxID=1076179 RepID=A0A645A0G4_9ZZZZ
MKKIIFCPALIFFLTLSIACEHQLDVDFSNEKPLIVMNGIIEPDVPITVSISKSFLFTDTDSTAPYLKDVSVELHINNKLVEKMQLAGVDTTKQSSRRGVSYFRSVTHAKIGDRVRLEANAPGLETVWAETVIPMPPTIEKVDTATYITPAQPGNDSYYYRYYGNIPNVTVEPFFRMMRLHIGLKASKSNESNYFGLRISKIEPSDSPDYEYVPWDLYIDTQGDPIFANNPKNSFFDAIFEKNNWDGSSSVFTDNLFKNDAYTLNVSTTGYYTVVEKNGESYEVRNPPLEITVFALSPELYRYLRSAEERRYDDEIYYISEPKVTFTNVNNGIGVVGAISRVRERILPKPYPGSENTIPR